MENLFSLDSILCSPSWCRVGLAWTSTRARTTSTTSTELANHLAVRILATKSSTLPRCPSNPVSSVLFLVLVTRQLQ